MIFSTLNPETTRHRLLVHLPTSPVYCSHCTLGNPKLIFQQYYSYIRQVIYIISKENKLLPPYPPHAKMSPHYLVKCKTLSSKHWWLSKEPVVMCGNWNVRQTTSQQVFNVTTFCTDTHASSLFRH